MHAVIVFSIGGECVWVWVIPAALTLKTGPPFAPMTGSGQLGTPWERMHWANFRSAVSICCTRAGGQSPASSALMGLLIERPAGRQQVLAGALGRLVLGVADPKGLRVALGQLAAAGRVGVLRHAVGAHALGVGDG